MSLEEARPVIVGPMQIVPSQLMVVVEGVRLWLTPREMEVLLAIATRPGRVLTRAEIYEPVWGRPLAPRDRSVDVYVRHLRVKLAVASRWAFIHSHQRLGYRFEPEPVIEEGRL